MPSPDTAPVHSGIVMYPETGNSNAITPALARQIGMATNAYVPARGVGGLDGEVVVGTAHAIGYDPQLLVELSELYGQNSLGGQDEKRERQIVHYLGAIVNMGLEDGGIRTRERGDLAELLAGRHIDIVLPPTVDYTRALMYSIAQLAGIGAQNLIGMPSPWAANDYVLSSLDHGAKQGKRHPLLQGQIAAISPEITGHTIHTTAATLSPAVTETLTLAGPSSEPEVIATSNGFRLTSTLANATRLAGSFDVPKGGANGPTIDALLRLAGQSDDPGSVHSQPELSSQTLVGETQAARLAMALALDPMNDSRWYARLN